MKAEVDFIYLMKSRRILTHTNFTKAKNVAHMYIRSVFLVGCSPFLNGGRLHAPVLKFIYDIY